MQIRVAVLGIALLSALGCTKEEARAPAAPPQAATQPVPTPPPVNPVDLFKRKYADFLRRPIGKWAELSAALTKNSCTPAVEEEDLAAYYRKTPVGEEKAVSGTGYPPFVLKKATCSDPKGVEFAAEFDAEGNVYLAKVKGTGRAVVERAFAEYFPSVLAGEELTTLKVSALEYEGLATKGDDAFAKAGKEPVQHLAAGDRVMLVTPDFRRPKFWTMSVMTKRKELDP